MNIWSTCNPRYQVYLPMSRSALGWMANGGW